METALLIQPAMLMLQTGPARALQAPVSVVALGLVSPRAAVCLTVTSRPSWSRIAIALTEAGVSGLPLDFVALWYFEVLLTGVRVGGLKG